MTREELDRLAELHKRRRASQCAWEEFTDEVLLAFPALLAAARERDELLAWQREAADILRCAANGHALSISRADSLALLARVKP